MVVQQQWIPAFDFRAQQVIAGVVGNRNDRLGVHQHGFRLTEEGEALGGIGLQRGLPEQRFIFRISLGVVRLELFELDF